MYHLDFLPLIVYFRCIIGNYTQTSDTTRVLVQKSPAGFHLGSCIVRRKSGDQLPLCVYILDKDPKKLGAIKGILFLLKARVLDTCSCSGSIAQTYTVNDHLILGDAPPRVVLARVAGAVPLTCGKLPKISSRAASFLTNP